MAARAPFTVAGDGTPPVVVDDEPRVEVVAQSADYDGAEERDKE